MGRFKLTNKETDTEVVKGIMAKEGGKNGQSEDNTASRTLVRH